MKGVNVTVTGESLATNAAAAAQLGMVAAARVVRDAVVAVFGTNHGGVPSRPGMPPNSQTNNLRQSWEVDTANPAVYSEVEYAGWLELGTVTPDGKELMAARPYVDKSINDAGTNVEEAFIDAALPVLIGGRA